MDEKNKCENCGSESSGAPGTCCGSGGKAENTCGTCEHKCKDDGTSECACNCC